MTRNVLAAVVLMFGFVAPPAPAQDKKPPKVPAGTRAERDLAYVKDGHARQKLDLYRPAKADGPLPLVIWVHGGGWRGGSKEGGPALALLSKGYAVACVNYRLSGDATFPAQIEDCKAAVRWLRANAKKYGLDPDRFGAWGSSAGGHLVALLGTAGDVKEFEVGDNKAYSSRVQCVVNFFGPADLSKMGARHDKDDSPVSALLGGPAPKNKAKAAKASPVTYVTKDDAPFLIFHGDKDMTVPFGQSELLRDALKKAGVPVELVRVEGAGHGGKDFATPEVREKIEAFFAKHLKKEAKK